MYKFHYQNRVPYFINYTTTILYTYTYMYLLCIQGYFRILSKKFVMRWMAIERKLR